MRAALEALLREKHLDGTLPPALAPAADRVAATGCARVDAALGGGLRRGQLSEIVGVPSSGRSTLLAHALAAATADRAEAAALVDASDTFDPASAAVHGVDLTRLLWVRPSTGLGTAPDAGAPARALKAYSLILQAGGFGLVVLDLADVAPAPVRRLPWTTWMRLARMVEGSDTVALLVGSERLARSAGGATILLEPAAVRWQGSAARARLFAGVDLAPRVTGNSQLPTPQSARIDTCDRIPAEVSGR